MLPVVQKGKFLTIQTIANLKENWFWAFALATQVQSTTTLCSEGLGSQCGLLLELGYKYNLWGKLAWPHFDPSAQGLIIDILKFERDVKLNIRLSFLDKILRWN